LKITILNLKGCCLNKKLCISAYNIHAGGGRVVLLAFLKQISSSKNVTRVTCYIDQRLEISRDRYNKIEFIRVPSTIKGRFLAELSYPEKSKDCDVFYFLGNLPPLFKLNCKTILFIQNKFLLSFKYIQKQPLFIAIKLTIEFLWLKLFIKNIEAIEVQTITMRKIFLKNFPFKTEQVHVINYIDLNELYAFKLKFTSEGMNKVSKKFVYICSDSAHKNIENLILAFSEFNKKEPQATLFINLSSKSKQYKLAINQKVNIRLIQETDRETILRHIFDCEYFIFPSLIESLGLPLIEAREMGTKIIASNLAYVYDVCEPMYIFDPKDPNSILKALTQS
jgi:glycosyltransferase involved in cell wall biosynthesis